MNLTIGMATYDDFNGVYFTLQALRMYHKIDEKQIELIVIDNNPTSEEGKETKSFAEGWARARYIPMTDVRGTSMTRQRIFDEAKHEAVMCIDPHVLLVEGSVEKLLNYYQENSDTPDLLTGPLLYDDLTDYYTHFDDVWRAEMWGIWGKDIRGADPQSPPFSIPGQGLGLFTCLKKHWLGFNPNFRGFGGEEMYIHEKYRQAGHDNLCLPFLRWIHRFQRPGGPRYPISRWNKVRNYVLGHQELGLPLDRVYEHFVGAGIFPLEHWEEIIANPVATIDKGETCGGCGSQPAQQPQENNSSFTQLAPPTMPMQFPQGLDTPLKVYDWITEQDLPKTKSFLPSLKELASNSEKVICISRHREVTTAILAGNPESLTNWQSTPDEMILALHRMLTKLPEEERTKHFVTKTSALLTTNAEESDLLIIDNFYDANNVLPILLNHGQKAKKFIAVVGTKLYAEHGELPKTPGTLVALRQFLKIFPQWTVIHVDEEGLGMVTVSCLPEFKPKLPSLAAMAFNYTKFMVKETFAGEGKVTEEVATIRLDTCGLCKMRKDDRCAKCGCFLLEGPKGETGKAFYVNGECPYGFWQEAEKLGHPILPIVPEGQETPNAR